MTLTATSYSISEIAEATGLSAHTLRYYEREGLMLEPVDRASSTHRRYSDADLGWVTFLTKLRRTSMPIARVREYAELVRRGESTIDARYRLLQAHRETVLAQLADVTASLAAVDFKIATYRASSHNEKAGQL